MKRDPFQVLGVAVDAEAEVVAAAYRALAHKYHPDVNRSLTLADALSRMQELNWAKDELERDLAGWRDRAGYAHSSVATGDPTTARGNAVQPQEFDVHMTLSEWLAGAGYQVLSRLIAEGGAGNFAIATAEPYYVQFTAERGGTDFYVEAGYLPVVNRISTEHAAALKAMDFLLASEANNFVLQWHPDAPSAAQIAGTVLRDIYGLDSTCLLAVHVTLE